MSNQPIKWWAGLIVAASLILGTVVTWWLPTGAANQISVPPEFITQLAAVAPEESSPLLTDVYDLLASDGDVQQVLLLQAVPNEVPIVVATVEDSSDEEDATHWPSPWPAVNSALESGSIPEQTSVKGRHAGFDYVHMMIPVDETHSRILLINQAASAPRFGFQRVMLLLAGTFLLVYLVMNHE